MLSCMEDSTHDKEHIYRVLYNALEIAKTESNVDYDVLIASCLLHDIGRKEQLENVYSHFYTTRATKLAKERQRIAVNFYNCLYQEASVSYQNGRDELGKVIE